MSIFNYSKNHELFFIKNGYEVKIKKGQYLTTHYDESDWVYFLYHGQIMASFSLADGNDRILGYFLPGMTFARNGSFYNFESGGIEYKATSDATVYRLPRKLFLQQLATDKLFNQEYLDQVLKTQMLLIDRIIYSGENGIENKFAKWLNFMAKYYGEKTNRGIYIVTPTTQVDIASFLHVTRVSTNKLVQKYLKAKIIKLDRKHIIYFPAKTTKGL